MASVAGTDLACSIFASAIRSSSIRMTGLRSSAGGLARCGGSAEAMSAVLRSADTPGPLTANAPTTTMATSPSIHMNFRENIGRLPDQR
ncbi:hypothetical protein ACVWY2_002201 [Bradyrhizobium sp. JR6.1]